MMTMLKSALVLILLAYQLYLITGYVYVGWLTRNDPVERWRDIPAHVARMFWWHRFAIERRRSKQ